MNFPAGDVNYSVPCEVRIDAGQIFVSYEDTDGPAVYTGTELSPGHYKLELPAKKGRATLHYDESDDRLEGSWIESGYEGMWRIDLNSED